MPDPTINLRHQAICKACDDVVDLDTIDLNGYCEPCSADLNDHLDRLQLIIDPDEEMIGYQYHVWEGNAV